MIISVTEQPGCPDLTPVTHERNATKKWGTATLASGLPLTTNGHWYCLIDMGRVAQEPSGLPNFSWGAAAKDKAISEVSDDFALGAVVADVAAGGLPQGFEGVCFGELTSADEPAEGAGGGEAGAVAGTDRGTREIGGFPVDDRG
jgi:hypothetical protein